MGFASITGFRYLKNILAQHFRHTDFSALAGGQGGQPGDLSKSELSVHILWGLLVLLSLSVPAQVCTHVGLDGWMEKSYY